MTHFRKRIISIDIANVSENLRNKYRELLEKRDQLVQKQEDSLTAGGTKNFAPEEPKGIEISSETPLLEAGPELLPVVTEAVSDEPTSEQSEQSVQSDPRCSEPTPEEPLVNEAAATCSLPIAPPANKGKLILDATCAPADIRFPTDLGLLNDAREKTEQIIDKLYVHAPEGLKKPRTYRQTARKEFLSVAKLRVKSAKKIRNAIRQQLGYVGRNLRSIDALAAVVSLTVLNKKLYVKLLVMFMNLQKLLGVHFLRCFRGFMSFLMAINGRHSLLRPKLQRLGDWAHGSEICPTARCF